MIAIRHSLGMFVADLFKSRYRLEAENLFLRHQLSIALRRAPSRLRLRGSDRALLVWMIRLWPSLLGAAQVIQPETILRWHRSGFKAFWRWKSRKRGDVMPIVALLQQAAFDPEITHILTTAFDKAWDKFKSSGSALADDACAPSTRALLAKQIIETAQKGERNIDRLVENGVAYLREVK